MKTTNVCIAFMFKFELIRNSHREGNVPWYYESVIFSDFRKNYLGKNMFPIKILCLKKFNNQ